MKTDKETKNPTHSRINSARQTEIEKEKEK